MRDPNQRSRRNQLTAVLAAVAGVVAIVVVGVVYFDDAAMPVQPAKAQTTMPLVNPGRVDEQALWRSRSESELKDLQRALAEQASQGKAQGEAIRQLSERLAGADSAQTELRRELEAARKLAASLTPPGPTASPPNAASVPPEFRGDLRRTATEPRLDPREAALRLNQPLVAPSSGSASTQVSPGSSPASSPTEPRAVLPDALLFARSSRSGNPATPNASAPALPTVPGSSGSDEGYGYLPAGSFAQATLLYGVLAPTHGQAQGNPIPMVLHLNGKFSLPNQRELDLGDCRIVAGAFGDLSAERIKGMLETLSCVQPDGRVMEATVKGIFVGPDGAEGLPGTVVDRSGRAIALATMASFANAVGAAGMLGASTTATSALGSVSSVNPAENARFMASRGLQGATQTIARLFERAASAIYPVVESGPGRVVTVTITKGAKFQMPARAGSRQGARLVELTQETEE